MHVKDAIVEILKQGATESKPNDLLLTVMATNPQRPISLNHFNECLDKLERENRVTVNGSIVRLVQT